MADYTLINCAMESLLYRGVTQLFCPLVLCEMQLSNALNDLIQLSEEIKSIMYGSLYPCFYFLLQKAVTVLIKALYGVSPVTKIL